MTISIARPIDEVFTGLADVERWPHWLIASGVTRVTREAGGDGALDVGSKLVIEQRLAGVRSSVVEAAVTAFERPNRFAVRGRDADGITVEIDAALSAVDAGCRLEWSLRVGLPLRYRMFESMAAPQVRHAAALDLEAFRVRSESGSAR
jgi:uncharacterized protein YndB with AHSA1/START domain